MNLSRRTLLGGALGLGGVMTVAGCQGGGIELPTVAQEPPEQAGSPRPTGRPVFTEPGSIQQALAQVFDHVGDQPHYGTVVTWEGLNVTYDGLVATWRDGTVTTTEKKLPKEAVALDLAAVEFPSYPEIETRAQPVLFEDAWVMSVEVTANSTWGLPTVIASAPTHHGPRTAQLETSFEPLPHFSYTEDADYDAAQAELVSLAGVDRVSRFLVHDATMAVTVPWQERFGGTPDSPGVSVHRGRRQRTSYLVVGRDVPPPTPENLFPISEVRRDIIRKGAAELGADRGSWKGIVRLASGSLVYEVGGNGDDHAVYDAQGNRIG
ncbi:hypothetical protein ACPCG0_04155 [Propionibacteriaceae bacterium Y1923]